MALPSPAPDGAVLITGPTSGIGEQFARLFAERGHNLVLVARREDRLRTLADELGAGVRAEPITLDVSDQDARAQLEERVAELGLRIDVLVNNAGFGTGGPFHQSDLNREIAQLRVLCEAPVALTRIYLPSMIERRSGAIINVASTAGMQPMPNSAGYGAAKAHILSFSEAVSEEVRRFGVTVTALCPGPVRTELFDKHEHPVERLPRELWLDALSVAEAGIAGAERGKRVVIPGLIIRAGSPLTRLAPRAVQLRVFERLFRGEESEP